MSIPRTQAIREFLLRHAPSDLAALYTPDMEVQVNALPDGDPVEGTSPSGRRWHGWTDGIQTWKHVRIPPPEGVEFDDRPLRWDLSAHAEAVGLTGWDWKQHLSRWLGYDFDSLVGHQRGLTDADLQRVVEACSSVPWVTVRRSKSGRGLHLYVHLESPIPTANRAEHAALARAILARMVAVTGLDLKAQVDKLGGNLWVWHKKAASGGLSVLSQGRPLTTDELPQNWRDHIAVVEGKRARTRSGSPTEDDEPTLDELVNRTRHVPLDDEHRRVLLWFAAQGKALTSSWWFDPDRHMLVCHTTALKACHIALELRGIFHTLSQGSMVGDQNCFAFPTRRGAWIVRRHGQGTIEHPSWSRDPEGWTRCHFNHVAELPGTAASHGAVESSAGDFVFGTTMKAIATLKDLKASPLPVMPDDILLRQATLRPHKSDPRRVVMTVKREANDSGMEGWLPTKKGDRWERLIQVETEASEPEPPDDLVRHLCAQGMDAGWYVKARGNWVYEPKGNAVSALLASDIARPDVEILLGQAVLNYWELVSMPFETEYPGNRRWNRDAPQLAVIPRSGTHPTWDRILQHVGKNLDDAVRSNQWCRENGINTGAQYLLAWIAALFQEPLEPLPYLFLHGPQNSGKSILHEALALLLTRGYIRADNALVSGGRFNGELRGALLCVVEETNVRTSKGAYDRLKDWVTGRVISIHVKGETPYDLLNCTHWIQCANAADHCPVLPGDTRITMIYVEPLPEETLVPKRELLGMLRAEAAAFAYTVTKGIVVPPPCDRLRVPVVETADKRDQQQANRTELETFLEERTWRMNGHAIRLEDLWERFLETIRPERRPFWPKRRFSGELPPDLPRGRYGGGGYIHVGNITTIESAQPYARKLVVRGDRLVEETNG